LTEISQRYRTLVGNILKLDDSKLSEKFKPEVIAEFRQRHSDTAFPCRYRFCTRASSGFPSEKERQTHETSHRPRIKCPITSCEFHVFGFGSQYALDRHNFQYHKDRESMTSQGSRLIRRKFDLALRAHFMESEIASTQPKRPRIDAFPQFSPSDADINGQRMNRPSEEIDSNLLERFNAQRESDSTATCYYVPTPEGYLDAPTPEAYDAPTPGLQPRSLRPSHTRGLL